MVTHIEQIGETSLSRAKAILEEGGAVAFPTETVYGLGADARCDAAVAGIYRIKGRPSDNPLIVHVHKDYDIDKLVYDDRPYAKKLREAFLPGPLTLVYRSRGAVCGRVSCGLDTLAVRVPSHEGAQRFLRYVDIPVAAPSANLSKHISPVSAEHVYFDLQGRIPLILDGGASDGGIESTVCDVTGDVPVVLRAGLVSREMIASVVGCCESYAPTAGQLVRSPGIKNNHNAPACKTRLFEADHVSDAVRCVKELLAEGKKVRVLCEHAAAPAFDDALVLDLGRDGREMASNLYDLLRRAETCADVLVAVRPQQKDGIMEGVQNRLGKACAEE